MTWLKEHGALLTLISLVLGIAGGLSASVYNVHDKLTMVYSDFTTVNDKINNTEGELLEDLWNAKVELMDKIELSENYLRNEIERAETGLYAEIQSVEEGSQQESELRAEIRILQERLNRLVESQIELQERVAGIENKKSRP